MTKHYGLIALVAVCLASGKANAHDPVDHKAAYARYIANEGVLVVDGSLKILFDPLFHDSYGQYRTPSEDQRTAMLEGHAPFDGVDVVFISHAHGDHFDPADAIAYMKSHRTTKLIAPAQAVAAMRAAPGFDDALADRITEIVLEFGDAPVDVDFTADGDTIRASAVRIPHAGWPGRADVQNIVYRVSFRPGATVMHLGDADPNGEHYTKHASHWAKTATDMGFVPYWFFSSPEARSILTDQLRIKNAVGVHVPASVPDGLKAAKDAFGVDFFANPGEQRSITEPEKATRHE